ncbi:hypothetical protein FA15DRAFT_663912 [Coprinopsis marcescibilis]|uniref:Uncharacterized protein n=1 Tax=Coprinopsis marcescibilis TaxID=230819 RepID=A0A5C3LCR0_COPMA|nr:hypothetical protein FA15DRAFT_663912 [Coprinopsis marcescibilis]
MQNAQSDYFSLRPGRASESTKPRTPSRVREGESQTHTDHRPQVRSVESTQAIAQHQNAIDRIAKAFAG